MQLRGSKQAAVAGGAVIAALALAACSSSSSRRQARRRRRPPRRRPRPRAAAPRRARPRLSGTLNASGSTFQTNFQQAAISAFKQVQPGVTVNYGGGGSGAGRTALYAGTVQFAGSDSPIPAADKSKVPAGKTVLYFPVQIGPIAIAYNLSGVTGLKLDATTLAKIFSGQDHDLERPGDQGAQLRRQPAEHPDHPRGPLGLLRHHRRTSRSYLMNAAGSAWTLGTASTINWPKTAHAANGGSGLAQAVKSTPGSIGYVDFSTATASGLSAASIKNSAGDFVAPSPAVGHRRRDATSRPRPT